jgi:hypothetical protein
MQMLVFAFYFPFPYFAKTRNIIQYRIHAG